MSDELAAYLKAGSLLRFWAIIAAGMSAGVGAAELLRMTADGAYHAALFVLLTMMILTMRQLVGRISKDAATIGTLIGALEGRSAKPSPISLPVNLQGRGA